VKVFEEQTQHRVQSKAWGMSWKTEFERIDLSTAELAAGHVEVAEMAAVAVPVVVAAVAEVGVGVAEVAAGAAVGEDGLAVVDAGLVAGALVEFGIGPKH